jgi:tRNA G18 (ribose-2'-O)-methylase SpoU
LALLLDNWRSLFNVGAAFRTADAASARPLYLCGITPTPAHRKLAKTALGAEQAVPWRYCADGAACAAALKAEGSRLWVLEGGTGAVSLFDCFPPADGRPLVLAAGNERTGVDPGIVALADAVVYLPMAGVKESLNVAVALSIAVYWLRGRAGMGPPPAMPLPENA